MSWRHQGLQPHDAANQMCCVPSDGALCLPAGTVGRQAPEDVSSCQPHHLQQHACKREQSNPKPQTLCTGEGSQGRAASASTPA
eukprot:366268-Chlamydomonas_euryale.AAC.5